MLAHTTHHSINVGGRLLLLHTPLVMGIVNVTPNSFYASSQAITVSKALQTIETHLLQGASIIDIGGASSKPNAPVVSIDEELQRVLPVVKAAIKQFPNCIISVDTTHAQLAQATLDAGASIINDISAGIADVAMLSTVANYKCPYILMHMQGTPSTMQQQPTYANVVTEVFNFFTHRIAQARQAGITDCIADVGFGFGKTLTHNYELLNNLAHFKALQVPLLVGVSRKSMLYNVINTTAEEALNATTVANTIALINGAKLLRVHDVQAAVEAIKIVDRCKN